MTGSGWSRPWSRRSRSWPECDPTRRRTRGGCCASLDWIPVDDVIAEHAGQLANRYLRSHPGVDPVDSVIAATTAMLDAALWTRNVKHFPMITDLSPPY
ncbi:MAG TPA: hypothetical protein VGA36_08790 [Nitriliruptorales bacterium]